MDVAFVEQFGDRWQDAVNRRAVGEILSLYAEDIRVDDPGLTDTATGRQAVDDLFQRTWSMFSDLGFTRPVPAYFVAPDAPVAVARWSARGTMARALDSPGHTATSAPVAFHGVDLWEFGGGLLSHWEWIYDIADIGRQIGALPTH